MIWFGIAFIAAFYLSCIVTNLVNCIPVSQSLPGLTAEEWAYQAKHDRCAAPELTLTVVQGFVNAATDFYGKNSWYSHMIDLRAFTDSVG